MTQIDENYLLDKKVKIYQPTGSYHASSDAVWLSAAVAKVRKDDTILDVGAGTGAVSLCLAERFKADNIQITGIELQPLLTESANKSAEANKFDFVHFINDDIFQTLLLKPCSFAHVVTNPPYSLDDMPSPNISKATAHNFAKESLAKWLDFCIKMIKPQGYFYIINRAEAMEDIVAHISGRLGKIEVFPLYSKEGQPAKRVIIRAQKDSKAPLIIHQGVLVHHNDGAYTAKAEEVLRQGKAL